MPLCSRCDGQPDCPDGSDEGGCHTEDVACGPRGQRCGHGGPCVPVERLCDGRRDCPDDSDESVPACGPLALAPEPPPCLKEEFRCLPDADCFPVSWVCDGHPDCPDGRDERGCTLDFPSSTTEAAPTTPRTGGTWWGCRVPFGRARVAQRGVGRALRLPPQLKQGHLPFLWT